MQSDPKVEQKAPIIAKVSDPQNDVAGGFTTYLISGRDQFGTFEIRRRFNDFFHFRQCLRKKWPGLYIPPIPQKQMIGNKDEHSIQLRRKFLTYFITKLATMKHLFYSSISQDFLRNKQVDMEKHYQSLNNLRASDLIPEFEKYYTVDKKNNLAELKTATNNFNNFLKKAEKELKNLRVQVAGIVQSRNIFMQNLNHCNTATLPQYQKNVYAEYLEESDNKLGLVFMSDFKVQDNIRSLRDISASKNNPFDLCLDMLIFESREVDAMQQAIALRDQYESELKKLQDKHVDSQAQMAKLSGGKTTFKSLFSKGSKNQQLQILQKQIPELKKEIQEMSKFCDIINYALGSVQIPTFKRQKQMQYYQMMDEVATKQIDYLASYSNFMKSVMDGIKKLTV